MIEDRDNLDVTQQAVERELGRWSGRLDVRPRAELVESVRAAMRLELHEQWLAAQPWPAPSGAALERVRFAVAAELGDRPRRAGWLRIWFSAQGLASLGAVAMLVLCASVIWYAGTLRPPAPFGAVDHFASAVTDSSTDAILREVQSLEEDVVENGAFPEDGSEPLEDLVREMDRLLDEQRDPSRSTSELRVRGVGGLG
jgi:hypothetical protein